MGKVKCVIFDYFNTLVGLDTESFFKALNSHKTSDADPRAFLFGDLRPAVEAYDACRISFNDFYNEFNKVYKFWDFPPSALRNLMISIMRPDEEMLIIKRDLIMNGIQLALISNLNRLWLEYSDAYFPQWSYDWFSYRAISCKTGVCKPDARVFTKTLEDMGLEARECIFVDDLLVNVDVFRSLGGIGFHYNIRDEHLAPNGKMNEERERLKQFLVTHNCL